MTCLLTHTRGGGADGYQADLFNPKLLCVCGELKSEHYDELDPPEFMNGRAVQVDACRSFSQCGCEGFEERTP